MSDGIKLLMVSGCKCLIDENPVQTVDVGSVV